MANNDGTTSLLGAVVHGHAEIVRALILAGADKDKKTHDGLHVGGSGQGQGQGHGQ